MLASLLAPLKVEFKNLWWDFRKVVQYFNQKKYGCVQCWTVLATNRGDSVECLSARVIYTLTQTPLISAIMASDSFGIAIANTFVRLHSDNASNLHTNGEMNKSATSSLLH